MMFTPDSQIRNILELQDAYSDSAYYRLRALVREREKSQDFLADDIARGLLGLFNTLPSVGECCPDVDYLDVIRHWTGETCHPDLLFHEDRGHITKPAVYLRDNGRYTLIFERSEQCYAEIKELLEWCERHGLFFWVNGESKCDPGYSVRFGVSRQDPE